LHRLPFEHAEEDPMNRRKLSWLAVPVLQLISLAAAYAQVEAQPVADGTPDSAWSASTWVWLVLAGVMTAFAVMVLFSRFPARRRQATGLLMYETIEDAHRLWRDIQVADIDLEARAEADKLKRELDELEHRIGENPDLANMPALLARAREIRGHLQRIRDRHGARRAA
jgi:hypothetical protein